MNDTRSYSPFDYNLDNSVGKFTPKVCATKTDIKEAIDKLVDGSPANLDTLKEIADQLTTLSEKDVDASEQQEIIKEALDKLVGGAPESYNTLKEIADYIASDKQVTETVTAQIEELKARIGTDGSVDSGTY